MEKTKPGALRREMGWVQICVLAWWDCQEGISSLLIGSCLSVATHASQLDLTTKWHLNCRVAIFSIIDTFFQSWLASVLCELRGSPFSDSPSLCFLSLPWEYISGSHISGSHISIEMVKCFVVLSGLLRCLLWGMEAWPKGFDTSVCLQVLPTALSACRSLRSVCDVRIFLPAAAWWLSRLNTPNHVTFVSLLPLCLSLHSSVSLSLHLSPLSVLSAECWGLCLWSEHPVCRRTALRLLPLRQRGMYLTVKMLMLLPRTLNATTGQGLMHVMRRRGPSSFHLTPVW